MQAEFIGVRDGRNCFEFVCTCGYEAELGIPQPLATTLLACPECGGLFIQHLPTGKALFENPRLIEVVRGAA
jgi:hypothetical protein